MLPISRLVLIAIAAAVVAAGGLFLLLSDGDDTTSVDDGGPLGTPLSELLGTAVPGTGPIGAGRPEIGEEAPDFALLDVRDQQVVHRLSDFRGTPVVLNWYASWCQPCKNELPLYQAASQALDGQVVFFAVNLIEPQATAQRILDELGVTFPAALDPNSGVSDRWRVSLMPTTFFIDAEGVLVSQRIGEVTETELQTRLAEMGVAYTP
jgi:thiol-disulfide isomerase/thioredoxin